MNDATCSSTSQSEGNSKLVRHYDEDQANIVTDITLLYWDNFHMFIKLVPAIKIHATELATIRKAAGKVDVFHMIFGVSFLCLA